jgi:hypothetical protein
MATRLRAADITIGGKVPAALLAAFLDELNSTGAKVGRHDGAVAVFQNAEQVRKVLDDSGHLLLVADKESRFSELADFCVKHRIPFDRRGNGGSVYFRQGMTTPMPSDKRSESLLDTGNIRPVAKELAGLVSITLTREKVLAAAVKVIRHLNNLLPPELPPLEIGK